MATIYKVIESYAKDYDHRYPINSLYTQCVEEDRLPDTGYGAEMPAGDVDIIQKHLYKEWEDGKLILREDTEEYSNPGEFILDELGRPLYTVTRFTEEDRANQYKWLVNQLWVPVVLHVEAEEV